MNRTLLPKPLISRTWAVGLIGTALSILVFPNSCVAKAEAPCTTLSSEILTDGEGADFSVVHRRCLGRDVVDICQGAECEPDRCLPAEVSQMADVSLQPPMPLRRASGAADVLVVRRVGQGAYPQIAHYSVRDKKPVCESALGMERLFHQAQRHLDRDETFGSRGGTVGVASSSLKTTDRVVLTQGVYRPEDPNCCPSQRALRIWAEVRGGKLELARAERVDG